MFKVVPDQLRISDGWVRCGQCDEVFDANVHLFSEPAPDLPPEPASPQPVAITSPDPAWAASLKFAEDEHASTPDSVSDAEQDTPPDHSEDEQDVSAVLETLSDPATDDFLSQSPAALAHGTADELDAISPGDDELENDPVQGAPAANPRYVQAEAPTRAAVSEAEHVSFMRNPQANTVWQRAGVRVVLLLCAVVAITGLLLQIVVHERDRLAAMEPATRPALLTLCEWLSCTVSPLRNIDALVIDSSSFTKVRTDVYRLNITLKNNGPVPLAPPALELTLTDMQDQSLLRRVLTSKEVGFTAPTLAAGGEFSAVLPIAVKMTGPSERVSGYRLLAFYP